MEVYAREITMSSNTEVLMQANDLLAANAGLEDICVHFNSAYIAHTTGKTLSGGHKIVKGFVREIKKAFSDIEISVDILMAENDRVAWRRTWKAVQTGAYKGFPATNKKLTWSDMVVTRFEDGLIVEDWLLTDLAEQLLKARK